MHWVGSILWAKPRLCREEHPRFRARVGGRETPAGDGGKQQRELFSKVESLASSLEELHEVPIAPELTVPFAVLDHIDKAENPDQYWKQVVDTTVEVRLHATSGGLSAAATHIYFSTTYSFLCGCRLQSVRQNKGRAEALQGLKDALGADLKGSTTLNSQSAANVGADA